MNKIHRRVFALFTLQNIMFTISIQSVREADKLTHNQLTMAHLILIAVFGRLFHVFVVLYAMQLLFSSLECYGLQGFHRSENGQGKTYQGNESMACQRVLEAFNLLLLSQQRKSQRILKPDNCMLLALFVANTDKASAVGLYRIIQVQIESTPSMFDTGAYKSRQIGNIFSLNKTCSKTNRGLFQVLKMLLTLINQYLLQTFRGGIPM